MSVPPSRQPYLDELRRGCEDFAAVAEEAENTYYFNFARHDKLNVKFVRTDFGSFTLYFAQLIGPVFYFGFFVNWCVLALCLWCILIFIWGLTAAYLFYHAEGFLSDASEEDRNHLTDET